MCLFLIVGDQIFPTNFHPAVPLDDVVWLVDSMEREGWTFINSLKLLRQNKFPADYSPTEWVAGMILWNIFEGIVLECSLFFVENRNTKRGTIFTSQNVSFSLCRSATGV